MASTYSTSSTVKRVVQLHDVELVWPQARLGNRQTGRLRRQVGIEACGLVIHTLAARGRAGDTDRLVPGDAQPPDAFFRRHDHSGSPFAHRRALQRGQPPGHHPAAQDLVQRPGLLPLGIQVQRTVAMVFHRHAGEVLVRHTPALGVLVGQHGEVGEGHDGVIGQTVNAAELLTTHHRRAGWLVHADGQHHVAHAAGHLGTGLAERGRARG